MPIQVTCQCGKLLNVHDGAAGKQARCPACNAVFTVPEPEHEIASLLDSYDEQPQPQPGRRTSPLRFERSHRKKSKALAVLAVAVVLGVLGGGVAAIMSTAEQEGTPTQSTGGSGTSTRSGSRGAPAANMQGEVVYWSDIHYQYGHNEVAADARYKGKRVNVSMSHHGVMRDAADRACIVAPMGGTRLVQVYLYFANEAELANVKPYDPSLVVNGRCKGYGMGAVFFEDCRINTGLMAKAEQERQLEQERRREAAESQKALEQWRDEQYAALKAKYVQKVQAAFGLDGVGSAVTTCYYVGSGPNRKLVKGREETVDSAWCDRRFFAMLTHPPRIGGTPEQEQQLHQLWRSYRAVLKRIEAEFEQRLEATQ